jgi:hypothetical protein
MLKYSASNIVPATFQPAEVRSSFSSVLPQNHKRAPRVMRARNLFYSWQRGLLERFA